MRVYVTAGRWLLIFFASAIGSDMSQAGEATWPQWQGTQRDNISTETALLKVWPEGGPTLLWTASGCGKGYSSVAVKDQTIYTAGTTNGETFVTAFDLAGRTKWRSPNGKWWQADPKMTWARSYGGARGTPTVNDGLVYHLNETGGLSAFDARTGTVVWSLDVSRKFEAKCPDYGYTESVLIDGDRLICCPGGAKGFMVALDKKTGSNMWVNTELTEGVGFASPILADDKGVRQIITLTEENLIGVDVSAGKLLWRYPFTNKRKNNYGAANEKPAWVCLDFETGQRRYRERGIGMGSVT